MAATAWAQPPAGGPWQPMADPLPPRAGGTWQPVADPTPMPGQSLAAGRGASNQRDPRIRLVGDIEGPLGNEDVSIDRLRQMQQESQQALGAMETQDVFPEGPGVGPDLTARWGTGFVNNGLWLSSRNSAFRLHVGGRTQYDSAFFHAPQQVQDGPGGIGPLRDGTDFRRARIRLEGSMFENTEFCVEYDFVDSTNILGVTPNIPSPRDLWWNFSALPVFGNLRIGNQKEPFGFERLESSRFLNFMERSFNTEAFYSPFSAGFSPGAQLWDSALQERMTWAIGLFRNVTNNRAYEVGGGAYALTGRLTALPIYQQNGLRLVHLGVGFRGNGLTHGTTRFRTRGPERAGNSAHWPVYADTGLIRGTSQQDVDFELVSVMGPMTLQAEWNLNYVQDARQLSGPTAGTLFYQGGYCELSYFLTGEHREYVKRAALFDRVVPIRNAYFVRTQGGGTERGLGAWQVGARYNYLNLNNNGINGGILNDTTFGLSWFLNPNMKIQWNYSLTARRSGTGQSSGLIQGYGMRLAHDF